MKSGKKSETKKKAEERKSLPISLELYSRIEAVSERYFEGRAVVRLVQSVMEDVLDMIEKDNRVLPRIVAEYDARQNRAPFRAAQDAGRKPGAAGGEVDRGGK